MNRIDTQSLAIHLEVALSCADPDLLEKLKASDNFQRRHAASSLALHLAGRLECFDIVSDDLGQEQDDQQLCFQEIDTDRQ